ncbi:hypothetical protein C8J57DRAFT_1591716 [Mycena rebaudengoi]|nr:hypothetical protein C8J57DRAFT_1591716 [Mycena rebaudengoi]
MYGGVNDWLAGCTGTGPGGVECWWSSGTRRSAHWAGMGAWCGLGRRDRWTCWWDGWRRRCGCIMSKSPSWLRAHEARAARLACRALPGPGRSILAGTLADLYIKVEHKVLVALAAGTHVILCGYTNTERGFLPVLFDKLCAKLELPPHLTPSEERDAEARLHGRGAGKRAGHLPAGDRVAHSSA